MTTRESPIESLFSSKPLLGRTSIVTGPGRISAWPPALAMPSCARISSTDSVTVTVAVAPIFIWVGISARTLQTTGATAACNDSGAPRGAAAIGGSKASRDAAATGGARPMDAEAPDMTSSPPVSVTLSL